eukprot:CAMPEP_0196730446 /NCGR_PEP_ID=MMETSP1091-20130531/10496_1 /TAXON_ID=302021 /ORGANISM="Rhodomonas sp., Strain CCMP768" /LENGTH=69 /DNA_ID=CAMNT_0042073443 /DNA_START=73 /DNA_END=278 /DNA_ORIENTATION=+
MAVAVPGPVLAAVSVFLRMPVPEMYLGQLARGLQLARNRWGREDRVHLRRFGEELRRFGAGALPHSQLA